MTGEDAHVFSLRRSIAIRPSYRDGIDRSPVAEMRRPHRLEDQAACAIIGGVGEGRIRRRKPGRQQLRPPRLPISHPQTLIMTERPKRGRSIATAHAALTGSKARGAFSRHGAPPDASILNSGHICAAGLGKRRWRRGRRHRRVAPRCGGHPARVCRRLRS